MAFFTTDLIDPDIAERLAASVEHFLSRRFDECVMVALPRIEAVIRRMVTEIGGSVWIEPTQRSRFGRQRSLGDLLVQLKDRMEEDWRRYLVVLLTNPLGMNVRNLYLHGLIGNGSREHAAALIHAMSFLAMIGPTGPTEVSTSDG